jgi:6-phosphogluconolactonase (cycloisomerase 2 family)
VKTVFAIAAAAAVSATGSVTQFPGKAGCVNRDGSSGCSRGRAVGSLAFVTVSPDGKSAYAVGGTGSQGELGAFARDGATGGVTQLPARAGCVLRAKATACTRGPGMETPVAVTVSPDGTLVVTAAYNGRAIGLYRRSATGALTAAGTVRNIVSPSGLAFRSDGQLLLVTSARGLLAFRLMGEKLVRSSGPIPCDELTACTAVAFSPDGAFAYAVAGGGAHGSITAYSVSTAGELVKLAATSAHAINQPRSVTVSPDGQNVYVAASVSDGIAVFTRDPTTGLMAQSGCLTVTGSLGACAKTPDLAGAGSLALSSDGKNVYVASPVSNRVTVFARAGDGSLRPMQSLAPRGVKSVTGVAVSPDGKNVYAAGHGLATLRRR